MNVVVRSEEVTERARAKGVHGTWLEIDLDRTRDVLALLGGVEKDIDFFKLVRVVAVILLGASTGAGIRGRQASEAREGEERERERGRSAHAFLVEAMLVQDGLPESSSDLCISR